jgi:hypothetical protein
LDRQRGFSSAVAIDSTTPPDSGFRSDSDAKLQKSNFIDIDIRLLLDQHLEDL